MGLDLSRQSGARAVAASVAASQSEPRPRSDHPLQIHSQLGQKSFHLGAPHLPRMARTVEAQKAPQPLLNQG